MGSREDIEHAALRWVLHRHEVPGGMGQGSWHYDWMIGPWPGLGDAGAGVDSLGLRSWRVMVDPIEAERFEGEDGPDHRLAYLDVVERVLDGERGSVRRVAGGVAEVIEAGRDRVVLRLWRGADDDSAGIALVGERMSDQAAVWRFKKL